MKISEKVERCSLSPMRKFHPFMLEANSRGINVFHLNIGQPDLPTPDAFFEAIRSFSQKTLAYAPSPGMPVLIQAIQDYYEKQSIHFGSDEIFITTGGSEALLFACLSILDNDTEVIVPEPYYPNYNTFISAAGGKICPLPTNPKMGYAFANREEIEERITPKTRAILVTNPGNPTGAVLSREDMRLIADIAKKHNLYIISDEVYREFNYDDSGRISCMGCFGDIDENLIIIDSVSKRFSSCGARIGCVITKNKQLQNALLKLCQSRLSVATLDQVGAAALYGVDNSYFEESIAEYRHRRDVCIAGLRKIPGVEVEVPKGAFYVMAQLPVDDTDRFQHWLLTQFDDNGDTVMFAPGAPFYTTPGCGKNEVRIAYVLEADNLTRAIEILGNGIDCYRKSVMGL